MTSTYSWCARGLTQKRVCACVCICVCVHTKLVDNCPAISLIRVKAGNVLVCQVNRCPFQMEIFALVRTSVYTCRERRFPLTCCMHKKIHSLSVSIHSMSSYSISMMKIISDQSNAQPHLPVTLSQVNTAGHETAVTSECTHVNSGKSVCARTLSGTVRGSTQPPFATVWV